MFFLAFILVNNFAFAQNLDITGKVTTGTNATPLSGVTVSIKDKQIATTTNADGTFTLSAAKGSTLVFTHVGYTLKEVVLNSNTKLDVQLNTSAGGLDEVVVVGYGSKRKRDITAAISTVNMSDIGEAPSRGVTQLLQGQAPGVVVKQKDGRPGAEFEVRVRGISSLGAGSEPLYVIDGFAMGTSSGVNINPNDIESISILKDAAATAIYGARGSNGVVLITTRSAKEGQTRLNVSVDYGVQNIPKSRRVTVLNGPEFAQFKKEVWMDNVRYFQNREPSIDEVPIGFRYPEQTKYSTNWFNEILHNNAPYTDYNISMTSGSGPIKSMLSIGYYKEEGAIIKTNYDRFSIRANIGGQVNKFITVGWNTAATYSRQNLTNTDGRNAIVGSTLIMDPREPMYDSAGKLRPYIGGSDGVFGYPNPVFLLNNVINKRNIADILSNGFVEVALLKNLRFRSSANVRLNYNNFRFFQPSTIGNLLGSGQSGAPPKLAIANENTDQLLNYSLDQLLTYAPNIGENHSLDFLAGFTAQEETLRGVSGSGNTFPDDLVPYLGAAILRSSSSFEAGWSLLAYIGRVNYAFEDKYLLSASIRREGSSRFGVKNKYGTFPAASIGWRVTKEKFMPKLSWLTDLKLRASVGETGNNNIGNYSSLAFLGTDNYILGNAIAAGKVVTSFANSALKWEKSRQVDIGMDLSLFSNKVVVTAEYYKKITNDMLLPVSIPAVSGFTTTLDNIGKVENKGFEFAVDYRAKVHLLNIRNSFNIAFNRSKILAIKGPNDMLITGNSFYGGYNIQKVGRPIGMIYGYKKLGIFNTQDEINKAPKQDGVIPGGMRFWDADGNGEVTYDTKDMVEIGNPSPKFTWAHTLAMDYKKFDFNILLIGAQGFQIYRNIEASTMNMDGVFNVLDKAKDRWRSPQNPGSNPNDVHSQGGTNYFKWSRESSDRYVYDASYLWIKNISLGYALPKIKSISSAKVFISVTNAFLFTKYPGNNPDVSQRQSIDGGNDDEAYPVPRTFAIGAKLNF
ncbi:SusC/RagA family TonB-linked outer membrane protein [Segetibacter aerophilus]|uniref:SusC/RagA family TonB-linked outer membrane protein n=1 Tax=Segetibacter aerophilus TaxID=670293 RepID=A0A512B6L9_9BACT|nr:SusC/RagA family TonB-linked outer membrane protein [Segetibacter aerophilus]